MTERIRPIHTEEQYDGYLAEVEELLRDPSAEAQERAEVLIVLLDDYENKHFPVSPPDPIAALEYYLERKGLKPADLQPFIGPRQIVHAVLSRKRQLSKSMIQRLHRGTGIPLESLLGG